MNFMPCQKSYVIHLDLPEARRWAEVIAAEREVGGRVVAEAAREFERVPELARWVFARLYQSKGGLYQGEIEAWAQGLGVSVGTATMLNCAYELSHLRWPKILGCTAGVCQVAGLGLVHARNLDWSLPAMGAATRLFRFCRGEREFVSVGVPGQVGVLSGMVSGGYSVTINWAPPAATPNFDFGPSFLLRDTLETCDDYPAAVKRLSATPLSTSAFFLVCGIDAACVIERLQSHAEVREWTGAPLIQANHHIAKRFLRNNKELDNEWEDRSFCQDSFSRVASLQQTLASAASLADVTQTLHVDPVLNPDTCQQMLFCPASGEVQL